MGFRFQDSVYKLTHRGVQFTFKKQNKGGEKWWPRLTFSQQRFSWLKVDFEKWRDPDAEESSEDEDEMAKKMRDLDINSYEVRKIALGFDYCSRTAVLLFIGAASKGNVRTATERYESGGAAVWKIIYQT